MKQIKTNYQRQVFITEMKKVIKNTHSVKISKVNYTSIEAESLSNDLMFTNPLKYLFFKIPIYKIKFSLTNKLVSAKLKTPVYAFFQIALLIAISIFFIVISPTYNIQTIGIIGFFFISIFIRAFLIIKHNQRGKNALNLLLKKYQILELQKNS